MGDAVNMQTDTEAEMALTVALGNKLCSSDLEMQNMKCMMQIMAETMIAKQHMMNNDSVRGIVPESQEKEKPTK